MFRYRRLADAQPGHQVTDCLFAFAQQVEDAAPVGLGQNFEHVSNMTTKKYSCQGIYEDGNSRAVVESPSVPLAADGAASVGQQGRLSCVSESLIHPPSACP